jgi:hypothetical protein
MQTSRETVAATLRELRAHKRLIDAAIEKLEAYADTAARVARLIPRDEFRELMELAKRSQWASSAIRGWPPAPRQAA